MKTSSRGLTTLGEYSPLYSTVSQVHRNARLAINMVRVGNKFPLGEEIGWVRSWDNEGGKLRGPETSSTFSSVKVVNNDGSSS